MQDILTRLNNLRDEIKEQEGDAQEQEIALRRLRADYFNWAIVLPGDRTNFLF